MYILLLESDTIISPVNNHLQFFGIFYWTSRHCTEDTRTPIHRFWRSPAIQQYTVLRNNHKLCISYSIHLQSQAHGKWKSFLIFLYFRNATISNILFMCSHLFEVSSWNLVRSQKQDSICCNLTWYCQCTL